MNPETKTRWLQLCEQAVSEQDPEKHADITREIKRIASDEVYILRQQSRAALN